MRTCHLLGIFGLVSACTGGIETDDPGVDPPAMDSKDVQVVVRDGQVPQASVEVIFQNADDTVIADAMTDADGRATTAMPAGGNVTVIRSYPAPAAPADPIPPDVYTYVGVKPGDHLVLGHPASDVATASAINVLLPVGTNGTVKVTTPCGSGQGTAPAVAVTILGCTPDTFYVAANDASALAHAAYSENVDLRELSLHQMLSTTVSATNVTPGTTVTVEQRLVAGSFFLATSGAKRIDAAAATVALPQIDGVDQVVLTSSTATNRTQVVAVRSAYTSSLGSIDASAGLIASVSAKPSFSPTAGIAWVEATPGAPDLVISSLAVTRGGPASPDNKYVRTIIAPYAAASLQVPALPGAGAQFTPAKGDQVDVALGLVKLTGGYDAVRATAFTVANLTDLTPAGGQLTVSYAGTRRGF